VCSTRYICNVPTLIVRTVEQSSHAALMHLKRSCCVCLWRETWLDVVV
jgi:hypothetical protein